MEIIVDPVFLCISIGSERVPGSVVPRAEGGESPSHSVVVPFGARGFSDGLMAPEGAGAGRGEAPARNPFSGRT